MQTLADPQPRYVAYHRGLGHTEKTVSYCQDSFLLLTGFLREQHTKPTIDHWTGEAMTTFAR